MWITSDSHFGHKNIVKFQQRPESHELLMLYEWIKLVPKDSQILHLGDVFMGKGGNPEKWASVVSLLPGHKFLIKGNHDKLPNQFYENAGFTIIKPFIWKNIAFTHRPITKAFPFNPGVSEFANDLINANWKINIHGHIHGNTLGETLEFDGSPLEEKEYINVSVEVTEYRPRQLGGLIRGGV